MKKSIIIALAATLLCVFLTACGREAPQDDAARLKAVEAEQAAKDKATPEQSMVSVGNDDVMKGYKPQAVQPGVQPAKASTIGH